MKGLDRGSVGVEGWGSRISRVSMSMPRCGLDGADLDFFAACGALCRDGDGGLAGFSVARCRFGMSMHCGGSTNNAGFAKELNGFSSNLEKTNAELMQVELIGAPLSTHAQFVREKLEELDAS